MLGLKYAKLRGNPMSKANGALRITLIYAGAAALWIVFSDRAVEFLTRDPERLTELSIYKGLAFVVLTAGLLYILIRRNLLNLSASEEELRKIIEAMPEGVIVMSATQVMRVNSAAAATLGVDREELIGMSRKRYLERFQFRDSSGNPAPVDQLAMTRAFHGQIIHGVEHAFTRADGREIYLSASAAPSQFIDRRNEVSAVVMVLRDITERKHLEQMRDDFLSNAAHELKTPVAVIKTNSEMIERFYSKWPEEKKLKLLRGVDQQCEKITELIQEVLETARARSEGLKLERTRFDLVSLANDVVEKMRTLTAKHRILVSASETLLVEADAKRIEKVVINLIENAIKFSPKGGDIAVTIRKEDGQASMIVEDTGIGIEEREKPHIFERFYKSYEGSAKHIAGMGIGLNLCREIVDVHGGTMGFESQVGRGSRFFFSLPLTAAVRRKEKEGEDGSS